MFTIYWTPGKQKPYCPKCGDRVSVRRNPLVVHHPDLAGTKPRWTEEEKKRLIDLYNTTSMMTREIAAEIGKTDKAVRRMIERLELAKYQNE